MIEKRVRKDGVRFVAKYKRGGKTTYVGTFGSRDEAKEAYQDFAVLQRKIERGELPPDMNLERTFGDAADAWLASLRNRRSRSAEIYKQRVSLYLHARFGGVKLAAITSAQVMDLRDELAIRYAPATVNGALVCLSSSFTYFRKRQWIDKNPCHGVESIEDPSTAYNWIRTKEEITRLLAACAHELRDMVAMAVGSGLRLDEMLHIQWADIDLERRLVTVHRGRQGTVKAGKVRHVPILDPLLPLLQRRALKRGGTIILFPGRAGAVRSKPGVTKIYKLALRRAGLDDSLRWHDLRHTFASHWVMNQGDIFRLSKVLGHSSVRITEQRYAHLAPEAFEQDYHRVNFHVPSEPAQIYSLERDASGRIKGRRKVRPNQDGVPTTAPQSQIRFAK